MPNRCPSPPSARGPAPAAERTSPGPPLEILLVEDVAVNRLVARRLLEALGHRVTEAADGAAAVRLATATAFDAILMDISLPGLDGVEAMRAIRADVASASARAPVIAVTGHARPAEIQGFLAAGMVEVLTKPLRSETLARVLDGRAAPRGQPKHAGPPADEGEAPWLDLRRLAALREDLGNAEADCFIAEFLRDGDGLVGSLAHVPADEEGRVALRRAIHRLAGSAALFGAIRLRGLLATIEDRLGQGDAAMPEMVALPSAWKATSMAMLQL